MSASETLRLATALGALGASVWPQLDEEGRRVSRVAVDAFVDAPTPSRFLAAARQLVAARRARRSAELSRALDERTFAAGLGRLSRLAFVSEELRAELAAQPHDAPTGRRLGVLAALLEAHAELAARLRNPDGNPAPLVADRRDPR